MLRRLKIALIGARGVAGSYSGIETYYEELGSRLAARGHEVTAYCRNHFTPEVDYYRGIKVRRLPALRSKHLETISHSLLSTLDSLRRNYDVVQYHAIGSAPLSLIPRAVGFTTVVSVRGLDWQRGKWGRIARAVLKFGERASVRCPHACCVVSAVLQEHFEQQHGVRPHMIPNAVVPPVRAEADRIRRWGLAKDNYILFAGRISPEKGIDVLLEAMRPYAGRKKLAIAGGSSFTDGYIDHVRSLAFEGVEFLGSVDRATMQELFSNCYAYVLPSVMEGLSISLLEAVSYGCCTITTAIPENLEVVSDCGLSFEVGNVAELSSQLGRVISDPRFTEDSRRRTAERARSLADWDEVAERTEAFYYEILSRRGKAVDAALPPTAPISSQ